MSAMTTNMLDAIAYYEAVRDRNEVNRRAIAAGSNAGGIADGMLSLIASLVQSMALATGESEAEVLENFRSMCLAAS